MAQPRYRLSSVLELRSRAKQEAARTVASSRRQLLEAEAELIRRGQLVAECKDELDSARGRMLDAATGGIPAWKLADFRSHLAALKRKQSDLAEEQEQQRSVVAKSEAELDRAISGLNEASK